MANAAHACGSLPIELPTIGGARTHQPRRPRMLRPSDSPLSTTGMSVMRELLKNHGAVNLSRESLTDIARHIRTALDSVPAHPITGMEALVSEACNLHCDYCFEGEKRQILMRPEVGVAAVDFLMSASKNERELVLLFFGGEPFLNFACIRKMVEHGTEQAGRFGKSLRFTATTNGTVITEEIAEFLSTYCFGLMLSVDGTPEVHDLHRFTASGAGSYRHIEKNLPLIAQAVPPERLDIRITVSPDVCEDVSSSVIFVAETVPSKRIVVSPAWGVRWTKRQLGRMRRQMEDVVDWYSALKDPEFTISILSEPEDCGWWGCRAGKGSVAVTASGEIVPCSAFLGSPSCEDYILGDVFEGITHAERRAELILLTSQRGVECNDCGYSSVCSGGCPTANEAITGNFVTPAPLTCWNTETFTKLWRRFADQHQDSCDGILNTRKELPYELATLSVFDKPKIKYGYQNAPKVSVILPTYKQGAYVARAIRSLLRQTCSDWELLVVNDCSPDDTHRRILPFRRDARIRYFRNHVNVGEWASVLRAFEASRGEYVAYLHSDDRWYPNHIRVLVDYLEANPQKAIAYTAIHSSGQYAKHLDVELPKEDGTWEWITPQEDLRGREKEIINKATWTFMVPPMVMHRRECLERHKPPTRAEDEAAGRTHVNGDGRLFRMLLADYDIGFIDIPTLEWVIHGENQHLQEARAGMLPNIRSGNIPTIG